MRGVKGEPIHRLCEHCGMGFSIPPHRLAQGRGRFCSRACLYRSQVKASLRDCLSCGAPFRARAFRVSEGDGLYCSKPCTDDARRGGRLARRRMPRDGDARQARDYVNKQIARGVLPRANTVPCVDCGHVWSPGRSRHEYDHVLGYGADHHEMVEAVCSACHKQRTKARIARLNFLRGWLACLQWMRGAESWERWVNRDADSLDLDEAF